MSDLSLVTGDDIMSYTFDTTNSNYTITNGDLSAERTSNGGVWDNERILPLIEDGSGVKSIDILIDDEQTYIIVGIKRYDTSTSGYVGGGPNDYGYASHNGYKFNNSSSTPYGATYDTGDTITIEYDSDSGTVKFYKNDIDQGVAFSGITGDYYFSISIYNLSGALSIVPSAIIQVFMSFEQSFNTIISLQFDQKISTAARLYYQFSQILATARRLNLPHDQVFDTAIPLHLQHEQVFRGMMQVALSFTQIFRGYGAPVALEFIQNWASHDYNLAFLPFVQLIGAQLDTVIQEIQFSVTIAGARVGVTDCQFDRDDFCQIATLTLADKRDYDNKQVLDNVVITVCGEQFILIIVDKPYDEQIQQGRVEYGYIIECASITCQLSEGINDIVRATRITASFPAGTMASVILNTITDGICSYSLNVTDFQTGGYEFDDVSRIDALRQVFPQDYGWVIETNGDGVLQISAWEVPDMGGSGQKTLQFKEKQLTPHESILYTQVSLKNYNQGDGQTGLTLEVVDNGDGTGTIYGYSVPWTESFSIFDSEDSSTPSLLITGGSVEEVEVEDADVEFVDYAASLSKPCYSDPVIDWGDNDSLSTVTYTESGALSTAIEPGYSVAVKVSYTTRRKVWNYDNRKVDVSQIRLKYDNESF